MGSFSTGGATEEVATDEVATEAVVVGGVGGVSGAFDFDSAPADLDGDGIPSAWGTEADPEGPATTEAGDVPSAVLAQPAHTVRSARRARIGFT